MRHGEEGQGGGPADATKKRIRREESFPSWPYNVHWLATAPPKTPPKLKSRYITEQLPPFFSVYTPKDAKKSSPPQATALGAPGTAKLADTVGAGWRCLSCKVDTSPALEYRAKIPSTVFWYESYAGFAEGVPGLGASSRSKNEGGAGGGLEAADRCSTAKEPVLEGELFEVHCRFEEAHHRMASSRR